MRTVHSINSGDSGHVRQHQVEDLEDVEQKAHVLCEARVEEDLDEVTLVLKAASAQLAQSGGQWCGRNVQIDRGAKVPILVTSQAALRLHKHIQISM